MGLCLAGLPSVERDAGYPENLSHLILRQVRGFAEIRPHSWWRQDIWSREQSIDRIE